MLKIDPAQIFDEIPEALRAEWSRGAATLDQICPKVKHEISAVRNEVLRRLKNWGKVQKKETRCVCSRCHKPREVCCSDSVRDLTRGMYFFTGEVLANNFEVHNTPVCRSCCPEHGSCV